MPEKEGADMTELQTLPEAIKPLGIGRIHYLLGVIGAFLIGAVASLFAGDEGGVAVITLLIYFAVAFRYKNIGFVHNWLLAMCILVPLVNLWVIGRCLYRPAGWATTRRMDRAGKIAFWIYWLGVLLAPLWWLLFVWAVFL